MKSSTEVSPETRTDCERLAEIFTRLQGKFILNLSKELLRGKISVTQYSLLGLLSSGCELSMSDIASKMGHTTAAATGLVDRLEVLGYAARQHAAQDRRKIMVTITKKGCALVQKVRADMVENLVKIMEHLDPVEQKTWVQIYEKIMKLTPCGKGAQ